VAVAVECVEDVVVVVVVVEEAVAVVDLAKLHKTSDSFFALV
jgi:hypothetical protein